LEGNEQLGNICAGDGCFTNVKDPPARVLDHDSFRFLVWLLDTCAAGTESAETAQDTAPGMDIVSVFAFLNWRFLDICDCVQ
jgi:hypothetical protein